MARSIKSKINIKWGLLFLLVMFLILLAACKNKETIRVNITEITDVSTGQPIAADVYVNGNLVSQGVTEATSDVPVPGEFEVRHPDYEIWKIEIAGKTDKTLRGPVKLEPLLSGKMEG
ncbi:MAG: hypothetical protein H8D34_12250 [Chloroflexi bacterium]|nr:hypothetical protein [Chloroflexota bacterium]